LSQILAHVFLGCFLFGFVLLAVSLLFGYDTGHSGFHFGGHDGGGGFHAGGTDAGGAEVGHGGAAGHAHGPHVSFFNYYGMLLFVTWFGGVGYVLNRNASASVLIILVGAVVAGLAGALLVFLFLSRFLLRGETPMNPSDYYMPGTLARVTSPIRRGGTGEVLYVQGGTRKTAGARSDEEAVHGLGDEVMIVRYDKGIAYVRSVSTDLDADMQG
jgi:hypothetical protein